MFHMKGKVFLFYFFNFVLFVIIRWILETIELIRTCLLMFERCQGGGLYQLSLTDFKPHNKGLEFQIIIVPLNFLKL